ncbi:MAG: hypothetical protein K9L62_11265 [Vallitaleaceae bacterium]|nr:hypothetical protein [Vallitaleaceae bacterium]
MKYTILMRPNYNVAYHDAYVKMCQVELKSLLTAYNFLESEPTIQGVNKATYMTFESEVTLSANMLKSICRLSFFYALFQIVDKDLFKPILIEYAPDFEEDLSIRLKYNGKTNEVITRMMMNLALYHSDFYDEPHLKLLDPLCGKGTTLFEAMINGYDAYGVEKDKKHVADLGTYITRYIKDARFKHTNQRGKLIHNRKTIGETFELQYAKDKDQYKSGDHRELKVLRADTTYFEGAFRHNSIHLIVTDLPYGVQHSGKEKGEKTIGLSGLLDQGLTSWDPYLKKGGAIAISWNIYTDTRESLIQIFEDHGYIVMKDLEMSTLEHRVSQAITRDIIIAYKG